MKRIWLLLVIAVALGSRTVSYANAGGGGGSMAGGTGGDPGAYEKAQRAQGLYQQGVEADNKGDFGKAIDYFKQALKLDPENADALNMLAYSQRKTGNIEEAFENYKKALQIRPNFAQAREYLGEAYIQAALKEMETLKSYGKDGQEQLQDLREAFTAAAQELKESSASPSPNSWEKKTGY